MVLEANFAKNYWFKRAEMLLKFLQRISNYA
jgi:hypothetical protein